MSTHKESIVPLSALGYFFSSWCRIFCVLMIGGAHCLFAYTAFAQTGSDDEEIVESLYTKPADSGKEQRNTSVYLKTNVAALSLLVGNLAAEVTLYEGLSINIPIYYSGLDWFNIQTKFRTLACLPELRYNFGFSGNDPYVHGLYVGVHAGVGLYNFAFNGDWRIQDADGRTPAWGGGLSLGYRLPLSRRIPLGLEFNLAGGVYSVCYDKFYNEADGPVAQRGIKQVWLIPDAVGISFYYRFDKFPRTGGRSSR